MKSIRNIFLGVIIITLFSCNKEENNKNVSEVSISNTRLERVEPTNWWVGFKNTSLQLLVKEENIGNSKPSISYAGVSIEKVHKARSKNYLFIDLKIDKTTKPGKFDIIFNLNDGTKKTHTYELKIKRKTSRRLCWF